MTKWILRLEGGLGNQLFQYAHIKSLQVKYGGEIYLDTHAFNKKQIRQLSVNHACKEELKHINQLGIFDHIVIKFLQLFHKIHKKRILSNPKSFNQNKYLSLCKKGLYIQYKDSVFESHIKPMQKINYVSGNYLSHQFFHDFDDYIKQHIYIKEELSPNSQEVLKQIKQCNSVCLHVRLGDYLAPEWKDKLYICTPEYYQKAVEEIKNKVDNPIFFIFSNRPKDFEWIKENISLDANVVYVNLGNNDYEDLKLMYNCKHFIMSNSTYSWWAQYLGRFNDKIVVAPSRFNNFPQWDMSGIYMKNWLLIDVR